MVLGHANMDEFALGFRSLSSRGGQTLNGYDPTRFPGGSSGGTAVALAMGLSVIGVGTDTGGSVRIPASFGGLVGLRPSKGLIPIDKVVPLSHSRDTGEFGFCSEYLSFLCLFEYVQCERSRLLFLQLVSCCF